MPPTSSGSRARTAFALKEKEIARFFAREPAVMDVFFKSWLHSGN